MKNGNVSEFKIIWFLNLNFVLWTFTESFVKRLQWQYVAGQWGWG